MIKVNFTFCLLLFWSCSTTKQNNSIINNSAQKIITEDIANFWSAYDAMLKTKDTLEQKEILQRLFLDKASHGQQKMIAARNYTIEDYLTVINDRPQFWASIRSNTLNTKKYNLALMNGVDKLKDIYPDLKESTIYYTMGAFRSPGTGFDDVVLIGTELALGDLNTKTAELPVRNQDYFKINPTDHLQFLIVHEYVHTQQKAMVHNLLCLSLYEGIADFVSTCATQKISPFKSLDYGKLHHKKVKARFEMDMFKSTAIYNWLWNAPDNDFNTADLGYYIGYAIAEIHYKKSVDKKLAIKELIELDYNNDAAIETLVDNTNYFSDSIENLFQKFEATRPTVLSIKPFENGSQTIPIGTNEITITFSEPLDSAYRNFDFGPMGEEALMRVTNVIGLSEDGRSLKIEVETPEANKPYQLTVGSGFRNLNGVPLKPYLIDFKTVEE